MNEIHDDRILALYILAHQDEAAAVTRNQKLAAEQLKECALMGNPDASAAINRLMHSPEIHPLLKEILAA